MYYNLAKAAEILGLSTGEVNRLREQGKLRAFKDGADWKFPKDAIEQYLTNMIKERSSQNSDGLLSGADDDDDKTAFAADSAAFETMFDQAGEDIEVTAKEAEPVVASDDDDAFDLAPADDDLQLAPESDDLKVADDDLQVAADDDLKVADEADDAFELAPADDDLQLAPESDDLQLAPEGDTPLTSEDSALADDLAAVDLSGSGSGDGLSLDNSDSGLSLLDDIGGSNVDLAGDDLVLGGSTGSGSGLNLSGDSGLSLMSDSDGGFELDAAVSEQGGLDLAPEDDKEDEDDSLFALAPETDAAATAATAAAGAQILNLDQKVDTDAPTELAADESVFELSTETTNAPQSSESMSSSVFTTEEPSADSTPNPFMTDDGADDDDDDGGIFGLAGETDNPIPAPVANDDSMSESKSIDVLDEASSDSLSDPFLSDESTDSPFAEPSDTASPFGDSASGLTLDQGSSDAFGGSNDAFGGGDAFGGASSDGGFGAPSDGGFGETSSGGDGMPVLGETGTTPMGVAASSTQFTGKDLIFLVPCLIFLILATLGALELCRTIWSYQEGSFSLGGPILETIAKMVKLM